MSSAVWLYTPHTLALDLLTVSVIEAVLCVFLCRVQKSPLQRDAKPQSSQSVLFPSRRTICLCLSLSTLSLASPPTHNPLPFLPYARFDPYLKEGLRNFVKVLVTAGGATSIEDSYEEQEYYVAFHSMPSVQR